jgi:mannan endo-1,4-beta-mannosidase
MLDMASAEWQGIIEDLDHIAGLLQLLKDEDIPVLWRPLHEAAGNWGAYTGGRAWFWWGASGPAPYIALWEFMYDYLTVKKGLNNLIWVWNGQNINWFPFLSASVDIVGYDYYASSGDFGSMKIYYDRTKSMIDDGFSRIIALTENGIIPDPDNCIRDGAIWSWFMVWNGLLNANGTEHLNHVYHHQRVITLDKLPDLTSYRLK